MEIITTDRSRQWTFTSKYECLDYLVMRAMNLKKCFHYIKRENGHLFLKCPVVNDMIAVVGSEEQVSWIFNQMVKRDLFRPGQLTGWGNDNSKPIS